MTLLASDVPSPPWQLRGDAVLCLRWLPSRRVCHLIPSGLSVVSPVPGRTLGLLLSIRYGTDSTLSYRELICSPGLIRYRGYVGAWISNIYVDDERSLVAGREIWGLPKELARFEPTDASGRTVTTVTQEGQLLCAAELCTSGPAVPLPLWAPALSQQGSWLRWMHARGTARCAFAEGRIDIPESSPLAWFGKTIEGRLLQLERFSLTLPGPKLVPFNT